MNRVSLQALLKETILSGITDQNMRVLVSLVVVTLGIFVVVILVDKILRKLVIKLVNLWLSRSRYSFLQAMAEARFINVLSLILFAVVLDFGSAFISVKSGSRLIDGYAVLLVNSAYLLYFIAITASLGRLLSVINIFYERKFDHQHEYSIYGYIKMLQFGLWCCALIVYVSFILNKSPVATLTGIGAVSAFFLLIFKDTFLGLVSSIQATANQIVKRGDWVVIPKYNVDGEVMQISISTIKIRNWDNTVTSIPTFSLTADAIHNWQAMVNGQARRIFRAVYIDVTSLGACDLELLTTLAVRYPFIANEMKQGRIAKGTLNLALCRRYLNHYLTHNSALNQEHPNLVRYLAPTPYGIPLQIYAFSKEVFLLEFEEVQSQIIEHVLQCLADFNLKLYQGATTNASYNPPAVSER